jgi:hypothetical protein
VMAMGMLSMLMVRPGEFNSWRRASVLRPVYQGAKTNTAS